MAPYLDVLDYLAHKYANDPLHPIKPSMSFQVDEWRLRKEVIYFGITAQIIDQFFEVVVPYVKHKWASYMKSRSGLTTMHMAKKSVHTINDPVGESKFLTKVRNEIELEEYDVNTDLREMCMQVSLFSFLPRTLHLTKHEVRLSHKLFHRLAAHAVVLLGK